MVSPKNINMNFTGQLSAPRAITPAKDFSSKAMR
jgi:hypothetical protein